MTASDCTNVDDEGNYSGSGLLDFWNPTDSDDDWLELYTSSPTFAYYQIYLRRIP